MTVEFFKKPAMNIASPLAIKVVRSESNPFHVTLEPNTAKTSGVQISLVATNLQVSIPESQRGVTMDSIRFELPKNKKDVLIVIRSVLNGSVNVHMPSVAWRNRSTDGLETPYVELERPWAPKPGGCTIQPLVLDGGPVCLRATVNMSGKLFTVSTHRLSGDPENGTFWVCPPDLLCKLATGEINFNALKKELKKLEGDKDEVNSRLQDLKSLVEELTQEKNNLIEQNAKLNEDLANTKRRLDKANIDLQAVSHNFNEACDAFARIGEALRWRRITEKGLVFIFPRIGEIKRIMQFVRDSNYGSLTKWH